jgi:hypothetical protein
MVMLRWTLYIIHLNLLTQIFDHLMALIDARGACILRLLRELRVSSVYFGFQSLHAVWKSLIFNSKLGYQRVNVLFVLGTQMTITTSYSTATTLSPCIEHLSPIEGHLFLPDDGMNLKLYLRVITPSGCLPQSLHHKLVSIRVKYWIARVSCPLSST